MTMASVATWKGHTSKHAGAEVDVDPVMDETGPYLDYTIIRTDLNYVGGILSVHVYILFMVTTKWVGKSYIAIM